MQHQVVDAPAALQSAIKNFWYLRRDFDERQPTLEVVPEGYAEIIFYFGSPCSMATPNGWQRLPSPFLVGLLIQPAVFHAEARLQAPLAQWLGAENVAATLAEAGRYFAQLWTQAPHGQLLNKAGRAMRAANGMLTVGQVAAAAHATGRTLERRFRRAAGYTVKGVSGLMRSEQVRNHLWQHPAASLAALAQEAGYPDQSHLGREFRRYSGTTPAAFARKARSWQQAVGHDFVAFVLT